MQKRVLPGNGTVPLERALSKLGIASRGKTREWITAGRLAVDGTIVELPDWPVRPETSVFTLDGAPLERPTHRTILLHKPRGCVTTHHDPDGKDTVFTYLEPGMKSLHPVGRLDRATSGLLLLTNDTRLSNALTNPESGVVRSYVVGVQGLWEAPDTTAALEGIQDGPDLLRAIGCVVRKSSKRESHLTLDLDEGKNREIRRLCTALNHEVTRLKRIAYGPIQLGELEPGEWRDLTSEEVESLRACCGLDSALKSDSTFPES